MKNYEILINNQELNEIIDSINEKNKETLCNGHGRYHTTFVVNTIETILEGLGYSKEIIELGKIAGLLHDIGVITGKKNHALKSSEMSKNFLDLTFLSDKEKEIIIHAIYDHSNGLEINSPIGAALLIADKIHLSKDRVLELGYEDKWHKNLLNIKAVTLSIDDKRIIISYEVTSNFSKEIFFSEWSKGFLIPIKACAYLGCECIHKINNKIVNFKEIED